MINNVFAIERWEFPSTIEESENKSLTVTFSPIEETYYEDRIIIHSNDAENPELTLIVKGDGHVPRPIMRIYPETYNLNFGKLEICFACSKAIIVYNDGDTRLEVTVEHITNNDQFLNHYSLEERTVIINPPTKHETFHETFRQTFEPEDIGGPCPIEIRVRGNVQRAGNPLDRNSIGKKASKF